MNEPPSPEDFSSLPTSEADAAKRQKADLWKQIAAKKRAAAQQAELSSLKQGSTVPEPEPDRAAHDPAISSEWAELFEAAKEEPDHSPQRLPLHAPTPPEKRNKSIIRRKKPLDARLIDTPAFPEQTPENLSEQSILASSDSSAIAPALAANEASNVNSVRREVAQPHHDSQPEDGEKFISAPAELHPHPTEQSAIRERAETEDSDKKAPEKTLPKASAISPEPDPQPPFWLIFLQTKWLQWGGSSLALSLAIHLAILGIGGFWVVNRVMVGSAVDFLPGGSKQGQQASQNLEHRIQQKKQPWLKKAMPLRKIAAVGSISDIVLPDEVPDLLELPGSNALLSSSKIGGGAMGGGGFGKGMGLGSRSGMVFQPLSMFGREIKAKKLALVLDVSSSMAPHLPRVIEEVDKVARDSIVVLFPGCGLDEPARAGISGDTVYRTNGSEFERFWRMGGMASYEEARKFKFSRSDPIQSESIFTLLSKRPQTFFIHNVGTNYAWIALLSDQVRAADALYWFSDFQDHVNFQQLEVLRDGLMRRKQKLYIQPFQRGSSFDLIKSQLVDPTGGDVIEAAFE